MERVNRNVNGLSGRYRSEELSTFYDVVVEGEVVSLYHSRHGNINLKHLAGDTYSARIVYGYEVTFLRAANGQASSLVISNDRVPGALFLRAR